MLALLVAVGAWGADLLDPWDLVRVDDPHHPDAIAVSATGALLLGPPSPGVPWRWETVAEPDMLAPEAVEVTHADLWHADGLTGKGVKIAVFDLGWFAGEADPSVVEPYQTHDCWAHPSCELPIDIYRPRLASEDGAHGWACAEVVRAIAPDAELHLVRVNAFTQFENAAAWAIREGIDVITMSMSFYNASFYDGTGSFAEPVEALERHGVLLVTSAGNDGRAHWRGPFLDVDGDGRMDLDGANGLDVWLSAGPRTLYLNWNQHGRCGDTDLDIYVYDADRNIVGRSEGVQERGADQCQPVERVRAHAQEDGWYRVEVVHKAGTAAHLEVDLLGRGGVAFGTNQPEGSVVDPASHPLAVAVGAVRASNYLRGSVEAFSSRGPTSAGLAKPDIAGPNGVSTHAIGAGGFFGTSASSPAVAALVALILEDDPSLTPRQAFTRLQGWALDHRPGFSQPDPRWGAGKARLPVRDPVELPCGRRPLVMPLLFLPFWWRRRRRTL